MDHPLEKIFNKKQKLSKMCVKDAYIIQMTFQEIADIEKNREKYNLSNPPFQTALDENKVEQMIESYKTYPEHLLCKSIITIAVIEIGNEKEYYLMDGQHRFEMIRQIYEQYDENGCVLFAIQHIDSEERMRKLFDELNKDSVKNKPYVSLPIFAKIGIEQTKKLLMEKYEGSYERNKNEKRSLYSVDEFIKILIENDYFEFDTINNAKQKTPTEIVAEIDSKHKKFFAKLKYLEDGLSEKNFTKCEIDAINSHKITIFFKNNNFIEHLINNDVPYHDTNTDRKEMTQTLKDKVWKKEFKNKTNARCPMSHCNNYINSKTKFGFMCGHIINVKNGGETILSNLRPLCMECYKDITSDKDKSKLDWDEYEENILKTSVWTDKFESDSEGECEEKNCRKKITLNNCYLKKNKSGKSNKLVCKKCK